ncbi:Permease of the drug/metabolite transporter (DMT) superfamily [Desulfosporosinus sp. I2]|nr:Permease of the drug/metabolite transporter (DMT) superfamily [Desulfosporosinus sp. I2]
MKVTDSLILALNPLTTALLASIFVGEKFTRNLGVVNREYLGMLILSKS